MLENTTFKKVLEVNLKNKLPHLALSGFIQFDSEDLAKFTTLTHLTKIGSIFLQSSAMPIVNLIPKLTNLDALYLNSTNIIVDPNPFFRSLTNLTFLDVQVQTNESLFSEEVANMVRLRELHINFQFDSKFPACLTQLPDLECLHIKKLLTIPSIITKFTQLRDLSIQNSNCNIPSELALMTQLQRIEIRGNPNLTTIPDVIFQMTWLTSLSLVLLTNVRYIPPDITRLTNLKSLKLNQSGMVSVSYEDLSKLKKLQMLQIMGSSCAWVPPQLQDIGIGGFMQGGAKLPRFWQDRRTFREFSEVYMDLYKDD